MLSDFASQFGPVRRPNDLDGDGVLQQLDASSAISVKSNFPLILLKQRDHGGDVFVFLCMRDCVKLPQLAK